MKSLNEDLKTGEFKRIYLLYGEEVYLKKQYKDRLSKAIVNEGDTMNYSYYEGKGIHPEESTIWQRRCRFLVSVVRSLWKIRDFSKMPPRSWQII